MKISIITAVYNRVSTIGTALASLTGQTYLDTEHVVIDGGSSDGTLAELARHGARDMRLVSEPDNGIYDALNKGLSMASGEVVGVLHSDDAFASATVLERVARRFADSAVDAVYGDLDYIAADGTGRIRRHWRAGVFDRASLALGWMPPHPTLFLRRRVIERHGGFDPSYAIAGDYDAILRYFNAPGFRAEYIPDVLVRMRAGGASNGSLSRLMTKSREDYRALRHNRIGGPTTLALKTLRKLPQLMART
jgi:glycosyltransferase